MRLNTLTLVIDDLLRSRFDLGLQLLIPNHENPYSLVSILEAAGYFSVESFSSIFILMIDLLSQLSHSQITIFSADAS